MLQLETVERENRRVLKMDEADRRAIERLAASSSQRTSDYMTIRATAVAAFYKYIRLPKKHWNNHMFFMSEIESPCPDYGLRARYRADVLADRDFLESTDAS